MHPVWRRDGERRAGGLVEIADVHRRVGRRLRRLSGDGCPRVMVSRQTAVKKRLFTLKTGNDERRKLTRKSRLLQYHPETTTVAAFLQSRVINKHFVPRHRQFTPSFNHTNKQQSATVAAFLQSNHQSILFSKTQHLQIRIIGKFQYKLTLASSLAW